MLEGIASGGTLRHGDVSWGEDAVDVWRITLAALRRWYVLVPLLGLTALVAVNVGNSVRPEYQATTTFMYVEGPQESERPNPFGSLVGANEIVSIVLNSVETKRALAAAGYTAAYEIQFGSRSSITGISTRADSVENAEGTGSALIEAASGDLVTRQGEAGIPEAAQVTLQVLEPPTVVAAVQNGKLRIQAIIGVIGAAIALLAAVLFDDIVGLVKRTRFRRRPARRAGAGAELTDAQTVPGVESLLTRSGDAQPTNGTSRHPKNEELIHTDQWVWPADQRPIPSGRPIRNPYFDPAFTRRSLEKLAAAENDAPHDDKGHETAPPAGEDVSTPSEAARRP